MKLGVMQPYLFPYIGYWQLINVVDKFVIFDDVNYIKRGWINRNKILMGNKELLINIPIQKASQNKLINELSLSAESIHYKKKMLKTIETCYKDAPYFKSVYEILQEIINYNECGLDKYIKNSITQICEYLSINTDIISSSDIKKSSKLAGQDKVLKICKLLGAKEYINPIGGMDLYSTQDFKNNGIELRFLKTNQIEYRQFDAEFVPNLSIIDVMMFNSPKEIQCLLSNYYLIKVGEDN